MPHGSYSGRVAALARASQPHWGPGSPLLWGAVPGATSQGVAALLASTQEMLGTPSAPDTIIKTYPRHCQKSTGKPPVDVINTDISN